MGLAIEQYERKWSARAFGKIMEIPFEDGMKELLRVSGLDKAGLLHDFFREKFSGISNREHGALFRTAKEEPAKESKRMLVALLGFVMDNFHTSELQTPQKIIAENPHCDSTYSLDSLVFWDGIDYFQVKNWEERFSGYVEKLEAAAVWEKEDCSPLEEIEAYKEELSQWSLKHEYEVEFGEKFWGHLKKLLDPANTDLPLSELIKRNE